MKVDMQLLIKASMLVMFAVLAGSVHAQVISAPDITRQPTLYVVPYAHLDTQYRWEMPQTISEYLLKTMRVNFQYIDTYPHYVFNFTGANRYRLMKEYFPSDFAKLQGYVKTGRWFPAGSSVEECDVNLPSAESIFRQVLYGNLFYEREFGKASIDFMLPDSFGFPASLPTILAHAGITGFSTQKLSAKWSPANTAGGPGSVEDTPEGIPFNVGLWRGPDGKTVLAALNPGRYASQIRWDLSKIPPAFARKADDSTDWVKRIEIDGKASGVYADYHYIGIGDNGGGADEETVRLLEAMVTRSPVILPAAGARRGATKVQASVDNSAQPMRVGDGPVRVISSTADQMFLDIKPDMQSQLPEYSGDLELTNHSAGSLTSGAYHKRWNHKNEILADEAEKASVAAAWLGGRLYPQQRINDAWMLVLSGQFHDVAAGTATPRAYQFTWNDDVIALNQFAGVLKSATQSVASVLDTRGPGIPIVVYNSLNVPREDIVAASLSFPEPAPVAVRVIGPDGRDVPSQLENGKVLFLATVPSVGYAVYHVQRAQVPDQSSDLKVTRSSLENGRYRIELDSAGDVSSIFDKSLKKELLSAPIRLAISNDSPHRYPAWNMDFDQEQAAPRAYVGGVANVSIVEQGAARIAVEVSRRTEDSTFAQTVGLSAGDAGNRIEFHDSIDWKTSSANLKAVFPLSAKNNSATYNWEVGTIRRPTETARQFEVASHSWIDLTDKSGSYGTTLLTDVKNGSDKPDEHTLRLTLLRTPGIREEEELKRTYTYQFNQDWGHHEILFGLVGHSGDWRAQEAEWQAYRLSTPLLAFQTVAHAGSLGNSFSLLTVSDPDIRVLALKKAERTDEIVLRLVEQHGRSVPHVRVKFAGPVVSAREVNGQEKLVGPAVVTSGVLETSFSPYQPRTFALRLGTPRAHVQPILSRAVSLHYDVSVSSKDDTASSAGFDGKGDCLPAELLPSDLRFDGVDFHLGPSGEGKPDAIAARGQTISLPQGGFNRVLILAAAGGADSEAVFRVGTRPVQLKVQRWTGFIGQWDTRVWKPEPETADVGGSQVALRKNWAVSANHATWNLKDKGSPNWAPRYPEDYVGLTRGYIKRADVAWYASHFHTPKGLNQPYAYSYLFAYGIDLPAGAHTLTLPDDPSIRILAISVARTEPRATPVQPLYDTLAPSGDSANSRYYLPESAVSAGSS